MNEAFWIKAIVVAIISCLLGSSAFKRDQMDLYDVNPTQQRYLPYLNSALLPVFILLIIPTLIPMYGFRESLELVLPQIFTVYLHISIYYLLLLLLTRYLRRRLTSRSCIILWMVPNFLYLTITNNSILALNAPNLVLNLSKNVFWALVVLWFLGFAFIMTSAYIQHFRFRRKILKDAYEVSDSRIRGIWEEEIAKLRIKKPVFKLIVSNAVSAPLTIGFFNKTMRVVLPPIEYSSDDLRLIFRHELIHICRQDAMNKFFLTFSKAMCWFNPLMWIAVERCSEDIELSCDETLLLEANEDHRKRYAHLLLNTSQESRGFTTCLSATAASIRYRLKSIVSPKEKNIGVILIALISFLLLQTSGQVAIAFGNQTVREQLPIVVSNESIDNAAIDGLNFETNSHRGIAECRDEEALTEYIGNLKIARMSGNYTFEDYEKQLSTFYAGVNCDFLVEITDQYMVILPLGGNATPMTQYHILEDVDWQYIRSLIA